MKNLKVWATAFLAGVGAARVCVWINTAIVHMLVIQGGWEVAEAVRTAPWILFALGLGLILSVGGMLSQSEYYKNSAEKRYSSLAVTEEREENTRRGA